MKFLSSFGIAQRLYAVSAALSLALVGVGVFAYFSLGHIDDSAESIETNRSPQLQRMAALELNVTRVSLQLRHAILSRTPEELAAALNDVGVKRMLIEEAVAAYEKGLFTVAGRERFAKLPPTLASFWQHGEANLKLIKDGQKAEAFAYLVDKTIPARNEVLKIASDTVKFQQEALHGDLGAVQSDARATLHILLGLIAATIVGLALFSWHVGAVLRRRVAASQAVADRVRDGDLTAAVHDTARDEFSPLLAALREMQDSLTRVVSQVRGNAESVATASAQIAQGNLDLSQRTEEQASALEQTAATMNQLGGTVRNNADNAVQANELARSACDVAAQGGAVVSDVVTTMNEISTSSRKIADIIGTIDGIAFQTNILALNAAVEAARAGEQGRGFAVVAGEVRSLAQRSAEAAKEIKSLIGASVERVQQGTTLVDKAGTTMQEIVASIRRVTDIIGEISSASAEQSSGVSQVEQAVNEMDKVTQQNAALVEESAAAAESLKGQAQQLVQAVAVFKTPQGTIAPAAVAAAVSTPAPTGRGGAERRGPNRATNVERPAFGARRPTPTPAPAKTPHDVPARTGTEDWTSF